MEKLLETPRETNSESSPPMIHYIDPARPTHFLCGAKVKFTVGWITSCDCIVCEELHNG